VLALYSFCISYLSDGDTQHVVNWKNASVLPFDPNKEDWSAYVERLKYYLVAYGITEEERDAAKKVAILISNFGPTGYGTIRSLVDAEDLR